MNGFYTCSKNLQDDQLQQGQLVESLRVELDAAREEKNQVEHRYNENLKEVETMKRECDVSPEILRSNFNFSSLICLVS